MLMSYETTYRDFMRSHSKPPKRVMKPVPPPNVNPDIPIVGVGAIGKAAICTPFYLSLSKNNAL